MKMTRHQKIRMYSHHDRDIDEMEGEFWPMMAILLAIIGTWSGFVHLIDRVTMDSIPWWAEPLTIIPVVIMRIMKERFNSFNPLHWWPVFWGYKIKLPDDERITIYPINGADLMAKHGGPLHVHIVDYEHIKFRRKRDAVIFGLRNF